MKLKNRMTGEVADGALILKTDDQKDPWYFESIAELVEHWEDCKGPLIKDEKVRKAISAWYESLPLDDLAEKRILFTNGGFCVGIYRIDCGNYVALKGIKERFYTVKELCGEE